MKQATVQKLIQTIDGRKTKLDPLDKYYNGTPPLAFLTPESREALGNRFGRMSSNFCKLSVSSIVERLRITGFTRNDQHDTALWNDWTRNNIDQQAATQHREALTLGNAYAFVWADAQGRPLVTLESAHQVAVVRDPFTREVVGAVKKWETEQGTRVVVLEPDEITHYSSEATHATAMAQLKAGEPIPNPLGVCPVVEFPNTDRLLDEGVSELEDLIPLQDSLNKLLADMLVGSEYYARPRRWASGIELEEREKRTADGTVILDEDDEPVMETVNPFGDDDRMMVSEDPGSKFGQLAAGDLNSYKTAIDTIISQIQAVSGLPGHYAGTVANQPPNADGLRAAEASLTARAEQKQHIFGRAWEKVAALMVAIRENRDPADVDVTVTWDDPATRSVAQEADAVVKLYGAGLLPVSIALAKLGYTATEIKAIREARRAEALDAAGTDLGALLTGPAQPAQISPPAPTGEVAA